MEQQLIIPELDDIPEDGNAEPEDAEILHEASVEEVEAALED